MKRLTMWLDSLPRPRLKTRKRPKNKELETKVTGCELPADGWSYSYCGSVRQFSETCHGTRPVSAFEQSSHYAKIRTNATSSLLKEPSKPTVQRTASERVQRGVVEQRNCKILVSSIQETRPHGASSYCASPYQTRSLIRTNPWVRVRPAKPSLDLWHPHHSQEALTSRDSQLLSSDHGGRLDESLSSGYGSQDSSPESSFHCPDWAQLETSFDSTDSAQSAAHRKVDKAVGTIERDLNGNVVTKNVAVQSSGSLVLAELAEKLEKLKESRLRVEQAVERARIQRANKMQEKHLLENSLRASKDMKWFISTKLDVSV